MLGVPDSSLGSGIVGRFGSLPCRAIRARWRHSRPTLATSRHALHEAEHTHRR